MEENGWVVLKLVFFTLLEARYRSKTLLTQIALMPPSSKWALKIFPPWLVSLKNVQPQTIHPLGRFWSVHPEVGDGDALVFFRRSEGRSAVALPLPECGVRVWTWWPWLVMVQSPRCHPPVYCRTPRQCELTNARLFMDVSKSRMMNCVKCRRLCFCQIYTLAFLSTDLAHLIYPMPPRCPSPCSCNICGWREKHMLRNKEAGSLGQDGLQSHEPLRMEIDNLVDRLTNLMSFDHRYWSPVIQYNA